VIETLSFARGAGFFLKGLGNVQGLYGRNKKGVIAIAGISHTIALDAALLQRYPDAKTEQASPPQPRWRWFARACQLKHRVPCALLIEADSGYLLVVSHLADSAFEFGLDFYDALLMSLDVHPDVPKEPHDGLFSFDQNPDAICWQKGGQDDLALERRLNDAAGQLVSMSPAQDKNKGTPTYFT
jgi:hypothetical protein